MSLLAVVLLQMVSCGNDQEANLGRGTDYVGYTFFSEDSPEARREWASQAVSEDDPFAMHFRALARELNMAIALTYLQRWPSAPRNVASVIDRRGRVLMT